MNTLFADALRKLRTKKGLTQIQLARAMFVNKATISKWESGSRMPDAAMISRLARVLDADVGMLLPTAAEDDSLNIIIVDDNKAILSYYLLILEEVVPNAMIAGFNLPQEAIEHAKANQVDLAILDIELGAASGIDLCRMLQKINPFTKVVYLTAYPDYSLDAWDTDACGFMVRRQLNKLNYPFPKGGVGE